MRTSDFVKSLRLLTEARAPVAEPRVETFEPVASNPSGMAAAIIKAAATRDAGGPPMPKPSTLAQKILDAGAKRRGEAR